MILFLDLPKACDTSDSFVGFSIGTVRKGICPSTLIIWTNSLSMKQNAAFAWKSTGGPGTVEALGTISRHLITTGPVTLLTVPDTSDDSDGCVTHKAK